MSHLLLTLFWLHIRPLHMLYRNPKNAKVQLQNCKELLRSDILAAQTYNSLRNRMVSWNSEHHEELDPVPTGYHSYPTAYIQSSLTNSLLFLQVALQIRLIFSPCFSGSTIWSERLDSLEEQQLLLAHVLPKDIRVWSILSRTSALPAAHGTPGSRHSLLSELVQNIYILCSSAFCL